MFPSTHLSVFRDWHDPEKKTASYERFVPMYQAAILIWSKGFGLGNEDAEDLTQEVLLKMWDGLGAYDPKFVHDDPEQNRSDNEGHFLRWLKSVVHNAAMDFHRKTARHPVVAPVGGTTAQEAVANIVDKKSIKELSSHLSTATRTAATEWIRSQVQDRVWKVYEQSLTSRSVNDIAVEYRITRGAVYQSVKRVNELLSTYKGQLSGDSESK